MKELFDAAIYGVLDAVSNGLSRLPSNPITDFLNNAWARLRQTFFNQNPTLDPSQTTGQLGGTITGTLGGADPDSDPIMYAVLQNPTQGTVNLNPDGTFTYTPGSDFDGRDVFIVGAHDTATPALNVLDLFGNGITEALVVVEQGTTPRVSYVFTYYQTTYVGRVQRWSDDAKIGLQWAAYNLADQIVPLENVTLTFRATAQYLENNNLASAGSDLTATTPGFFPTVVQSRIQTGSPSVTKDGQPVADGRVTVNFNNDWGYEGVVGKGQYDYESVMMHELMHAYGFTSDVREAGKNGGANQNWSAFDKFITNINGTAAIDPTTYAWKPAFNPNLTGGDGGLYFYGTNEALAFGGKPVPLYTPAKWSGGSSVSHLNDNFFNNTTDPSSPRYIQLMNAIDHPGIKAPDYLSSVEIGILRDLGYAVSSTTPALTLSLI
ncbi:Ig-like domain-containing protein [Mycolicibacterium sp. Dal123E01]|uniref:Ig-like domain-containing protein n=1 Tax=Mycolicibacterium sp. Dal123E01 TaxID=3457578 RepID=UPI00403EF403